MISEPGNPSRILKKYVKFALKEPGTFMRMKWEFISHTLGIGKAIVFREYYYDRWKKMPEFGFNDSGPRKAFVYYLKSYMTYMKIFCMPWLMYAAALALILIKRFGFKEVEGSLCFSESAFLVSVFYYGAYIIDTQAFEFRYFFPSWLILFLIICNLSADICFRKKYTRRILEIALVVWVSIGLLGGYRLYTELGRDTIRNVHANGTLLFENEMNRVYYLDGKIYFIAERNADTNYKFFLHYYPADGEMINNDFDFNDKKIATAFWDQKIAAADLPDQKIQNVEFGQYYYSKRFWEHTADISSLYDEMKR